MCLHGFTSILHGFILILYEFKWIMLTHMRFNILIFVLYVFISLVWPTSVPKAFFFRPKKHS